VRSLIDCFSVNLLSILHLSEELPGLNGFFKLDKILFVLNDSIPAVNVLLLTFSELSILMFGLITTSQ
jgi:hypothetical protein